MAEYTNQEIIRIVKNAQEFINEYGHSENARKNMKMEAYDEIVAVLGLEGWGEEDE